MKVELIDIKDIHPYEKNPRRNKKAIDYVANSLKEYGFKQPLVVDKEHKIIVGHTRYQAARQLKLSQVPVIVAEDLTDEQVRAYRIADNKTHEYSLWDDNLLSEELEALLTNTDISNVSYLTAFSEYDIDRILNGKTFEEDQPEDEKTHRNTTFNRRVAVLVLKNSYVNRGVATAVNGILEWGLHLGIQVDVICDSDAIRNNQFSRYAGVSNWVSATEDQDTTALEKTFNTEPQEEIASITATEDEQVSDQTLTMRYPIIRLEEAVRLRSSLVKALRNHTYDAILLNTVDTLFAVASMGLHTELDNLYYITHSPDDLGTGKTKYITDITHHLLKATNIKILCASERNRLRFLRSSGYDEKLVYFQPLPLGQPEFLEQQEIPERKGVLYIGPYEENKQPEVFISACKQTGLPALCITPSETSARKFKRRFLQEGIEHEIFVALTGKNKVEAMRRAAVAIIPSKEETFCFTAYECAHCVPTIVPQEREWTQAHADWCLLTPLADIPAVVKENYGKPQTKDRLDALRKIHARAYSLLSDRTIAYKQDFPAENALTKWLDKVGEGKLSDFFDSRPTVVIDELYFALRLNNHKHYEVKHTKDATYFKKVQ